MRARRWALGAVLTVALTACSAESLEEPDAVDRPSAARVDDAHVVVRARVTRVAGELTAPRRHRLAVQVRRLVADYVEAAYLGDHRAGVDGSFPGFTAGARDLAEKDARVLTGRGFRGADSVVPTAAAAYVAAVAPRRSAVGATARLAVDLDVTAGGSTTTVRVRGSLLLTPTKDGWRIFGYRLSRSDAGKAEGTL